MYWFRARGYHRGQIYYQEYLHKVRARQRSGEGEERRNGCPKGCFWRVRFFTAPLRFALETPQSLKGAEKKRTLQKTPFWTIVSPHDAFSAPLAHPHKDTRSNYFRNSYKSTPHGATENTKIFESYCLREFFCNTFGQDGSYFSKTSLYK